MTTGDKMSIPGEFDVHLDIKYHVAYDILVSGKYLTISHLFQRMGAFLKVNTQINHLLLNGEFQKVSPWLVG